MEDLFVFSFEGRFREGEEKEVPTWKAGIIGGELTGYALRVSLVAEGVCLCGHTGAVND